MNWFILLLLFSLSSTVNANGGGVDVGNGFGVLRVSAHTLEGYPTEQHLLEAVEIKMNHEGFENLTHIREIKKLYGCKGITQILDVEIQEHLPYDTSWGLLEKEFKGNIIFQIKRCDVNANIEIDIQKVEL